MITAIYPNTAVSKGGSWEIKTLLETGFAATLTTTFELKDKTESYNLIVGKGKIITLDKDAYTQVNGMPTQYNLSGTMNSNLKVDPNTGWIIEAKVNQLIAGNVEIKDKTYEWMSWVLPLLLVELFISWIPLMKHKKYFR